VTEHPIFTSGFDFYFPQLGYKRKSTT